MDSRDGANALATNASLPVNVVIHARYAGATQEIALNQSYIHTPQTSIDVNGTVSNRSALQLRPDYDDATAYLNLLYHQRAEYECDDLVARKADLKSADRHRHHGEQAVGV